MTEQSEMTEQPKGNADHHTLPQSGLYDDPEPRGKVRQRWGKLGQKKMWVFRRQVGNAAPRVGSTIQQDMNEFITAE